MKKLLLILFAGLLTTCATSQFRYNLTVSKSAPQLYLNGTGGTVRFYNTTITEGSGTLTLAGGNFNTGTNSILGTGAIGATGVGKRSKVWAVDVESTNMPTVNGVPISTTFAPIASPTFTGTLTVPALTIGSTLLTVTPVQLNLLSTITSDVQTQINAKQATLVSGTSIKTINGTTLLGSGDMTITGGGGSGSVESVAVTTANGISGTVATSTTTPNITLSLGAIAPTSVNSIVLSGSSTPTLAVSGTSSVSGVNTGDNAVNTLYSGLVSNATHTGQVTGSTALTIAAGTVTLANMANVATGTLFYRKTAGAGVPQVQTLATLKTDLGLTGTNSGDQTTITGNAATATVLQTARTINGTSFNGSANITVASNIAAGTVGNVMQSNGTVWTSDTPTDLAVAIPTLTGVAIPKLSTTAINAISTPAEGLLVYDLTLHVMKFYNGSVWKTITTN